MNPDIYRKLPDLGSDCGTMEIDDHVLSMIRRTNPEDYAVYRVENNTLHTLLRSSGLPALSGMTPEEYNALTEQDAAAIVLGSDRALVSAKLAEILKSADESASFTLTYRIIHKTNGFIWVRAKSCIIGISCGAPVLMVYFTTLAAASEEFAGLLNYTIASIYVIDKETHELLYVNQTAMHITENRSYDGMQCFRYFNGLSSPCPWCALPALKDGFAHVDENYVPSQKHWYRYDIRDIRWYDHDAAAFYCMDITEQKQRQQLDEERSENIYRQITAANPNTLAMFRLNLTADTCIDMKDSFEAIRQQQSAGTVDGYLSSFAETITDDEIRRDCMTRFTLQNMLREYQNGVTEMSIEYPVRASDGSTAWIDGFITMMQNGVSGDIEGIAYTVNATAQKVNSIILERISEEKYDHIGLINSVTHRYELWKKDGAYGLGSRQNVDYDAAFQDICEHYIFQEDRELFADHGKLANIVSRLDAEGQDSFVYRCGSKDGGCLYKQVKYIWLDSHHDLIMEAQTDITSLYEQQMELVRRHHEAELAKERALSAELIPAGIGVFDYTDGAVSFNYLNNGFYQIIGADRETFSTYEGIGVINASFIEDRPEILHAVEKAVLEKSQLRCRFRLLNASGRYRWVELVANHVKQNDRTERFYAFFYDIDELLQTQNELQEKELIFRDILKYSDILHFTYYPQQHRYVSEILPERLNNLPRSMDGYPESFIRYIGLNASDAESYRAMVRAVDEGDPEAECTVRMYYEGKSGWYRVHMLSIPGENGHAAKAIGNVFNVDRTMEAEKAIADERLRVESLRGVYLATACFNVSKDTEVTFNPGGGLKRSVVIDPSVLAEARGIEPKIDGQNPETLCTLIAAAKKIPDGKQRAEFIRCCSHEGMMRLYREEHRDVRLEYRRFVGAELIWMATRIIMMAEPSTGDILAFFYSRDISEQKKSEQITKLTLEKNCDYIALLNVEKHVMKFRSISAEEEAYQESWKRDEEADYDTNLQNSLKLHFPEQEQKRLSDRLSVENIVFNLEQESEYSIAYDRKTSDGEVRRKQILYRWLDEMKNEILVMQTDITAAYIQEQERTRQLKEALAEAEKANTAKTEFISRISHDIRTPISAIMNMTGFAREDIDDREKLLHDLDRIESSNTFLLSLINDVLDISKIDSGKIELHPEPYRFDEFIESISSIFEPLCQQNGQTFRILGCGFAHGRGVVVDRIRYNQIALNLLSNAVKYTPEGGTITYTSRSRQLPDGMIECGYEISDTGIGMSEQFQKTMFETFTQEYDNPERMKLASGTGLGLSIVKRLISLMNGTIEVESELGKGTCVAVSFVLPEALPESPAETVSAERRDVPGAVLSGTVLLAEDNEINIEIAVRILDTLGLKSECAENGEKAAELFDASEYGHYCAVLMDIQMPVMNGYDAARAIRSIARPDAGTVPIIAMTADAFEESAREAKTAGMDDYITKPVEPRKLLEILRKYITHDTASVYGTDIARADEGRKE